MNATSQDSTVCFTYCGVVPLPSDPADGVPCPCGCGTKLHRYNSARPLVCPATWKLVSAEDRMAVCGIGMSDTDRESAGRRVLNLAHAIRLSRGAQKEVQ